MADFVSSSIQAAGDAALEREIKRLLIVARLTPSREQRDQCRREAKRLQRILNKNRPA